MLAQQLDRAGPVTASMRRTLAELEVSLRIRNAPDLGGGAHVRAAAQLARVLAVADLDHAHDVAVLLAEQRHRAERAGLVERRRDRAHRVVAGIHSLTRSSTSRSSSRAERLAVAEVEAQLVRAHVGARLAHVAADRSRSAACSRCVAVWLHSVAWRARRSTRASTLLALVQLAPLEQHLGHAGPRRAEQDVLDARAAVAVLAFDRADV